MPELRWQINCQSGNTLKTVGFEIMDRLSSMAVFVKAVDLGSFAAAATALEMSSPMVGKHVRFLEERLGVQLIQRTTRRQVLTEFGRAYYDRCRLVLAEADAADALAAEQFAEPRGKLRVTVPVHFGRHCVVPVLLEMARRYSALELEVSFSDRLVDLVGGDYDLAIRTGRLADSTGAIARRLARQHMIVCASPAYLRDYGEPRTVEELAGRQAVVYRRSGAVPPWLFPREGQAALEIMPRHRYRLDDLDAIAEAAADGAGLAWLPSWLVRQRLHSGALVHVLPEVAPFLYDAYAVWPKTPHLPHKVRAAVDMLAAYLPGLM